MQAMDMSKQPEVKWFYLGPDDNPYGSFSSKDMMQWVNSGYFGDNVPVRTENDQHFYPIGEWVRLCGGKLPFGLPIHSWDAVASQFTRHPISMPPPPMHPVLLPPGLPPPNMTGMHPQRYPAYMPMPPNGMHSPAAIMQPMGMGPHGMTMQQHMVAPLISQPPSEPRDGHHSTNSQTPDSEGEFVDGQKQNVLLETQILMTEKVSVGTETMKPQMCDASTSTLPLMLNAKDVARLLSELFGQTVHIT
ncbi:unnamed protein product, partial [Mesorhabditis belari]|uniref:GYF domain-containing protein n=1 Tax=Mesorhabditis belari TaxID=2138241 RepID=A0AAF3EL43_9BILA